MQDAQNPAVPKQDPDLLTRLREGWLLRRAAEPSHEHWGMESALPWLQSQASAGPQS
jgi:hypothetical protein